MKEFTEVTELGGGYYLCRYKLNPPREWRQSNLNDHFGLQTEELVIKNARTLWDEIFFSSEKAI